MGIDACVGTWKEYIDFNYNIHQASVVASTLALKIKRVLDWFKGINADAWREHSLRDVWVEWTTCSILTSFFTWLYITLIAFSLRNVWNSSGETTIFSYRKKQSISFHSSQSLKGEQQNLFINSVWSHCEWMLLAHLARWDNCIALFYSIFVMVLCSKPDTNSQVNFGVIPWRVSGNCTTKWRNAASRTRLSHHSRIWLALMMFSSSSLWRKEKTERDCLGSQRLLTVCILLFLDSLLACDLDMTRKTDITRSNLIIIQK